MKGRWDTIGRMFAWSLGVLAWTGAILAVLLGALAGLLYNAVRSHRRDRPYEAWLRS